MTVTITVKVAPETREELTNTFAKDATAYLDRVREACAAGQFGPAEKVTFRGLVETMPVYKEPQA